MQAGALDLMDNGTNFVLGRAMSGRAMGMSASQVRDYFYKDLEYLRFLGFASAPDRRKAILDRVDWQKLKRRLARFREEFEDWTCGTTHKAEGRGAHVLRRVIHTSQGARCTGGLRDVNGAVAALLPVVVVIAVRLKRNSSQLLMPLVFAAHAGSMLALTGTPVNVLVSEAGLDAGVGGFGFFEFALVGVPLLAGTMAIIVLFGKQLLPERNGATMPADFSRHAKTLVEQYGLASGIYQLRVRTTSSYVGCHRQGSICLRIQGYSWSLYRRAKRPGRFEGPSWPRATIC